MTAYTTPSALTETERDQDTTKVPHDLLNDPRLSFKAKGIMCFLLSNPDASRSDIAARGKGGDYAIRQALAELRRYGYLVERADPS